MWWSCCAVAVLGSVACVGAVDALDAAVARASDRIAARDFQAACVTLRPFAKESTRDLGVWNLLGICESELGQTGAARNAFLAGLQIAPQSIPLNENLGLLYFNGGDYAHAKTYLERAVAVGSEKPGVTFSLAASQIRTGEQRQGLAALIRLEHTLSGQAAYWTERGWVELHENVTAAAASFDRALALAPEDVRALNGAASAAEIQKEDEKALSFLLRARKARPDDVRTLLHFGTVCLRRDLSVDAMDAVERAYRLAPSNNLALFLYARVQIAFQQWQRAHDLFTEFDRRIPNYAQAQYALGWLDTKLNRPAEARQHLERSVSLDPQPPDPWVELGQLDLDEGRLDDAESHLKTALDKQPGHAKANIAFGDLLLKKGDLESAKAHYETATKTDPRSGPAHYKLSTVLMRLHQNDRAAKERALGAELNAEATKAAKTVLVLAEPDGRLLSGEPGRKGVD